MVIIGKAAAGEMPMLKLGALDRNAGIPPVPFSEIPFIGAHIE